MKALFWFSILYVLTVPVAVAHAAQSASLGGLALVAGLSILFMSKFNELAELSYGPLKAKMRAQLIEAQATIVQLRKVASTIADASITGTMAGYFVEGLNLEKRFELRDKLVGLLTELGVNAAEIRRMHEYWNKGVAALYFNAICDEVQEIKKSQASDTTAQENYDAVHTELLDAFDAENWTAPSPSRVKQLLSKYSVSSESIAKLLGDYSHFHSNREVRDPAELFKRNPT